MTQIDSRISECRSHIIKLSGSLYGTHALHKESIISDEMEKKIISFVNSDDCSCIFLFISDSQTIETSLTPRASSLSSNKKSWYLIKQVDKTCPILLGEMLSNVNVIIDFIYFVVMPSLSMSLSKYEFPSLHKELLYELQLFLLNLVITHNNGLKLPPPIILPKLESLVGICMKDEQLILLNNSATIWLKQINYIITTYSIHDTNIVNNILAYYEFWKLKSENINILLLQMKDEFFMKTLKFLEISNSNDSILQQITDSINELKIIYNTCIKHMNVCSVILEVEYYDISNLNKTQASIVSSFQIILKLKNTETINDLLCKVLITLIINKVLFVCGEYCHGVLYVFDCHSVSLIESSTSNDEELDENNHTNDIAKLYLVVNLCQTVKKLYIQLIEEYSKENLDSIVKIIEPSVPEDIGIVSVCTIDNYIIKESKILAYTCLIFPLDSFISRCAEVENIFNSIQQYNKLKTLNFGGNNGDILSSKIYDVYINFQDLIKKTWNTNITNDSKNECDSFVLSSNYNPSVFNISSPASLVFMNNKIQYFQELSLLNSKLLSIVEDGYYNYGDNNYTEQIKLVLPFVEYYTNIDDLVNILNDTVLNWSKELDIVYNIFNDNLKNSKFSSDIAENNNGNTRHNNQLANFNDFMFVNKAAVVIWCRHLKERIAEPYKFIRKIKQSLDGRNILQVSSINNLTMTILSNIRNVIVTYENIKCELDNFSNNIITNWIAEVHNTVNENLDRPLIMFSLNTAYYGTHNDSIQDIDIDDIVSIASIPYNKYFILNNFDSNLKEILTEIKYLTLLGYKFTDVINSLYEHNDTYYKQMLLLDGMCQLYNASIALLLPVEYPLVKESFDRFLSFIVKGLNIRWNSLFSDTNAFIEKAIYLCKDIDDKVKLLKGVGITINNIFKTIINPKANSSKESLLRKARSGDFDDIVELLKNIDKNIRFLSKQLKLNSSCNDSGDWKQYILSINNIIKCNIINTISAALQSLYTDICGDFKNDSENQSNTNTTSQNITISTSSTTNNTSVDNFPRNGNSLLLSSSTTLLLDISLEMISDQWQFLPPLTACDSFRNDIISLSRVSESFANSNNNSVEETVRKWIENICLIGCVMKRLDHDENNYNSNTGNNSNGNSNGGDFIKDVYDSIEIKIWINEIILILSTLIPKANNFLSLYINFIPNLHSNSDSILDEFIKNHPCINDYETLLNNYKKYLLSIEILPKYCTIGFLRLNGRQGKLQIANKINSLISILTNLLKQQTINEINEFRIILSSSDMLTKNNSDIYYNNLNDNENNVFFNTMKIIKTIKVSYNTYDNGFIKGVIRAIDLLDKYNIEIDKQLQNFIEDSHSLWENLKKLTTVTENLLNKKIDNEINITLHRNSKLEKNAKEFKIKFLCCLGFQYNKNINCNNVDTILLDVTQHEEELVELESESTIVSSLLEILGLVPDPIKELIECRAYVKNVKNLWIVISNITSSISLWSTIRWDDIDVKSLLEKVNALMLILNNLVINGKIIATWSSFIGYNNVLIGISNNLPLILLLKENTLKPRHWNELMCCTGTSFIVDNSLTFGDLLGFQFFMYADVIINIVEKSKKELILEKRFISIKKIWNGLKFDIIPPPNNDATNNDSSFSIIIGRNTIETLDDHILLIQNMQNNKFISFIIDDVNTWMNKLNVIEQAINLWIDVDTKYSKLKAIFTNNSDIRGELLDECKLFDGTHNEYNDILNDIKTRNPLLLNMCTDIYKIKQLEKILTNLEICNKGINSYLKTKKNSFPRFYFISHSELLDILSKGSVSPMLIQPYLCKLFENVVSLNFSNNNFSSASSISSNNNNNNEAYGMYVTGGEYIKFSAPLSYAGPVESYLTNLITVIKNTLKQSLYDAYTNYTPNNRENWINNYCSQIIMVASQANWTEEVGQCIVDIEEGDYRTSKVLIEKHNEQLKNLINVVNNNKNLSDIERHKIMELITLDVYKRDVLNKLLKKNQNISFEWQSQLRYDYDSKNDVCLINILNSSFYYGYEYVGNDSRLIMTPLVNKCYIAMSQSLYNMTGNCMVGPTATGKTEVIKDLGRAFGTLVKSFACQGSMTSSIISDLLIGVATTGAWGIFDNINCLPLDVLSVMSTQYKSLLACMRSSCGIARNNSHKHAVTSSTDNNHKTAEDSSSEFSLLGLFSNNSTNNVNGNNTSGTSTTSDSNSDINKSNNSGNYNGRPYSPLVALKSNFEGNDILIISTNAIFITMNPSYLGRNELPSNLKILFRAVSMIKPDIANICDAILYSHGFQNSNYLSKQIVCIYELFSTMLSKQEHYDWGLRSIKTVLLYAGNLKRECNNCNNMNSNSVLTIPCASIASLNVSSSSPSGSSKMGSSSFNHINSNSVDECFVMRAVRDCNKSKIVLNDQVLFNNFITTIFCNAATVDLVIPIIDSNKGNEFELNIDTAITALGYQSDDKIIQKVLQLKELLSVHHTVYINGVAGSGKTCLIKIVKKAFELINIKINVNIINPKMCSTDQLYGHMNEETNVWHDGILSYVIRNINIEINSKNNNQQHWLIIDGEIDPLWIESLHSLMDCNQTLILPSNERIMINTNSRKNFKLIFEISNMTYASPASISRGGLLYLNKTDAGYWPYIKSWIHLRNNHSENVTLLILFEKYVEALVNFIFNNDLLKTIIPTLEISLVQSFCFLLDALLPKSSSSNSVSLTNLNTLDSFDSNSKVTSLRISGRNHSQVTKIVDSNDKNDKLYSSKESKELKDKTAIENVQKDFYEYAFAFAAIWAFGGSLENNYRKHFSDFFITNFPSIRFNNINASTSTSQINHGSSTNTSSNINSNISNSSATIISVFDYYFDPQTVSMIPWVTRILNCNQNFGGIYDINSIITTVDTERISYLMNLLLNYKHPVLLVGESGVGKSSIISSYIDKYMTATSKNKNLFNNYNTNDECNVASSQNIYIDVHTNSNDLQSVIEESLEKKNGKHWGPKGSNQNLVYILDNINCELGDACNCQSSMELLRFVMTNNFLYDHLKLGHKKYILNNLIFVGSMNHLIGKQSINCRLQRLFTIFAISPINDINLEMIYHCLMSSHFKLFAACVQNITQSLVSATLQIHSLVLKTFDYRIPNSLFANVKAGTKYHYNYNVYDINNVIYELLRTVPEYYSRAITMLQLWLFVVTTIYTNKFNPFSCDDSSNENHLITFQKLIKTVVETNFRSQISPEELNSLINNPLIFTTFINKTMDNVYLPSKCNFDDMTDGSITSVISNEITDYNLKYHKDLNIIIHQSSVKYIVNISRILSLESGSGHALIVHNNDINYTDLISLSCHILHINYIPLHIVNEYSYTTFINDLFNVFKKCGVCNEACAVVIEDKSRNYNSDIYKILKLLSSYLNDETDILKSILSIEQQASVIESIQSNATKYSSEYIEFDENIRSIGSSNNNSNRNNLSNNKNAFYWKQFCLNIKTNLHLIICMDPYESNSNGCSDIFHNFSDSHSSIITKTQILFLYQYSYDYYVNFAKTLLKDFKFCEDISENEIRNNNHDIVIANHGTDTNSDEMPNSQSTIKDFPDQILHKLCECMASMHLSLEEQYNKYSKEKITSHITFKCFVDFIHLYKYLYHKIIKRIITDIDQQSLCILNVDTVSSLIDTIKDQLAVEDVILQEKIYNVSDVSNKILIETDIIATEQSVISDENGKMIINKNELQNMSTQYQTALDQSLLLVSQNDEHVATLCDKNNISDFIKSFNNSNSMDAMVSILLIFLCNNGPLLRDYTFKTLKAELSNTEKFNNKLNNIVKCVTTNNVPLTDVTSNEIKKYVINLNHNKLEVENCRQTSKFTNSLYEFLISIINYSTSLTSCLPLKNEIDNNKKGILEYEAKINACRNKIDNIIEVKLKKLNAELINYLNEKSDQELKVSTISLKVESALKLINLLNDNYNSYKSNNIYLKYISKNIIGDALISAVFMNYLGVFSKQHREDILQNSFYNSLFCHNIPNSLQCDTDRKLNTAVQNRVEMTNRSNIYCENALHLLKDDNTVNLLLYNNLLNNSTFIENCLIITNSLKPVLIIDPSAYALVWLKQHYDSNFKTFDLSNYNGNNGGCNNNSNHSGNHVNEVSAVTILENSIIAGDTFCFENFDDTALKSDIEFIIVSLNNIIKRNQKLYVITNKENKEIEYNINFKLILITKQVNPSYSFDITISGTIVNFNINSEALEDVLLSIIVNSRYSNTENLYTNYVKDLNRLNIEQNNINKQVKIILSSQTENILSGCEFLTKIEMLKIRYDALTNQIVTVNNQINNINTTVRFLYRNMAIRGRIIYFIILRLDLIDPMYQSCLNSYINLFLKGLQQNVSNSDIGNNNSNSDMIPNTTSVGSLEDTIHWDMVTDTSLGINQLINDITFLIIQSTSVSLITKHKLMFLTMTCFEILLHDNVIPRDAYKFLIETNTIVMNTENFNIQDSHTEELPVSISSFISKSAWLNILLLKRIMFKEFNNIDNDIIASPKRFKEWVDVSCPEDEKLPLDYKLLNPFYKLLLIKILRPDRMDVALIKFIGLQFGSQYISNDSNRNIINVNSIIHEMNPATPLLVRLESNHCDIIDDIEEIAETQYHYNYNNSKLFIVSCCNVSNDESETAENYNKMELKNTNEINRLAKQGGWVIIQNIQLNYNYVNNIERTLLINSMNLHPDFRIILTFCEDYKKKNNTTNNAVRAYFNQRSQLTNSISSSLLQKCIKITSDNIRGLKDNIIHSLSCLKDTNYEMSLKINEFKLLTFSMCVCHSIINDRNKFKRNGWNCSYSFNNIDLLLCQRTIYNYLEKNTTAINWNEIRYIISNIIYGGYVYDTNDKILIDVYIHKFLTSQLYNNNYSLIHNVLSPCNIELTNNSMVDYVNNNLTFDDSPVHFGLHCNNGYSYRIKEYKKLFENLSLLKFSYTYLNTTNCRKFEIAAVMTVLNKELSRLNDIGSVNSNNNSNISNSNTLNTNIVNTMDLGEFKNRIENINRQSQSSDTSSVVFKLPLLYFIYNECILMNNLIQYIKTSINDVIYGINNKINDNDNNNNNNVILAIVNNEIPLNWLNYSYPSSRSLSSYITNLIGRYHQLYNIYSTTNLPPILNLSFFFNPLAFINNIMFTQVCKNNWDITNISIVTEIIRKKATEIETPSIHGYYVTGPAIENGKYDPKNNAIVECLPTDSTISKLPVLLIKVILNNTTPSVSNSTNVIASNNNNSNKNNSNKNNKNSYNSKKNNDSYIANNDNCNSNNSDHLDGKAIVSSKNLDGLTPNRSNISNNSNKKSSNINNTDSLSNNNANTNTTALSTNNSKDNSNISNFNFYDYYSCPIYYTQKRSNTYVMSTFLPNHLASSMTALNMSVTSSTPDDIPSSYALSMAGTAIILDVDLEES